MPRNGWGRCRVDPAKGYFAKLEAKKGNDSQPPLGNSVTLQADVENCVTTLVDLETGMTSTTSITLGTTTSTIVDTTTTTTTSITTSTTSSLLDRSEARARRGRKQHPGRRRWIRGLPSIRSALEHAGVLPARRSRDPGPDQRASGEGGLPRQRHVLRHQPGRCRSRTVGHRRDGIWQDEPPDAG